MRASRSYWYLGCGYRMIGCVLSPPLSIFCPIYSRLLLFYFSHILKQLWNPLDLTELAAFLTYILCACPYLKPTLVLTASFTEANEIWKCSPLKMALNLSVEFLVLHGISVWAHIVNFVGFWQELFFFFIYLLTLKGELNL